MKTIKLKIHSVVDLITNSSTVIFTYSENVMPHLKAVVNEMLKLNGGTEKFDDVFRAEIFCETEYYAENLPDEVEEEVGAGDAYEFIDQLKEQILSGEIEKPDWMIQLDTNNDDYPETFVEIQAKDLQYSELGSKLLRFLYSTNHEEHEN